VEREGNDEKESGKWNCLKVKKVSLCLFLTI